MDLQDLPSDSSEMISTKPRLVRRPWLILVFGLFLVGVMVYALPLGTPVVSRVVRWLPLPVARVGMNLVSYREAMRRYDGLLLATEGDETLSVELIRSHTMQSLVRERLIRRFLKTQAVDVDQTDVDDLFTSLEKQAGSSEAFAREVRETYGWSLATFRREVLVPYTEAKMAEEVVRSSRTLQTTKRARIDEAAQRILDGGTFDGVVLEYSEDATSMFNGDQGWMTLSEMPEEWRTPASRLPIGDVSLVIDGPTYFSLIRVDDRETVPVDEGEEVRVNLSALIVHKVSLFDALTSFSEQTKTLIFIRM